MPEGEDLHVLLPQPGLPDLGIGKRSERYRCLGLEAQVAKGFQCPIQIVTFQLKDEIEIEGCAQISVEDDGNSSDHQISDSNSLKNCENPLDSTAHAESLPWTRAG